MLKILDAGAEYTHKSTAEEDFLEQTRKFFLETYQELNCIGAPKTMTPDEERSVIEEEASDVEIEAPVVESETAAMKFTTLDVEVEASDVEIEALAVESETAAMKFRTTDVEVEASDVEIEAVELETKGSEMEEPAVVVGTAGVSWLFDLVKTAEAGIEDFNETVAAGMLAQEGETTQVEEDPLEIEVEDITSEGVAEAVNIEEEALEVIKSPTAKEKRETLKKIRAEGPGLRDCFVGDLTYFQIFKKHAGYGTLTVEVKAPKAESQVSEWKGAKQTVSCIYNPEIAGKYIINIKWEKEHIMGSPFKIKVDRQIEIFDWTLEIESLADEDETVPFIEIDEVPVEQTEMPAIEIEIPDIEHETTPVEVEPPASGTKRTSLKEKKPGLFLRLFRPAAKIETPADKVETPDVEAEVPNVKNEGQDNEIEELVVESETSTMEIERPAIEVETPDVEAEAPNVQNEGQDNEIGALVVESETSTMEIERPAEEVETPDVEIDLSDVSVELTLVEEEPQAAKIKPFTRFLRLFRPAKFEKPGHQQESVEVETPNVELYRSAVEVEKPSVQVDTPIAEVESPDVEVGRPVVEVETKTLEIETPVVKIETPVVEIEMPTIDYETPAVKLELPDVEIETPNVEIEMPAIEYETPAVELESPNVEVELTLEVEPQAVKIKTFARFLRLFRPAKVDMTADEYETVEVETPNVEFERSAVEVEKKALEKETPIVEVETPNVEIQYDTPIVDVKTPRHVKHKTAGVEIETPDGQDETTNVEFETPAVEAQFYITRVT